MRRTPLTTMPRRQRCVVGWMVVRLLDILAGRKDGSRVSGDVLVDEHRQPHNFKYMSGYVVQVLAVTFHLDAAECCHCGFTCVMLCWVAR